MMGKLLRGTQGCGRVLAVAFLHTLQRMSAALRLPIRSDVAGLESAIASADVISFDLYDTLMARCFHEPGMVHTAVRLIASERGLGVPDDWEAVRQGAESLARSRSTRSDIRFADIYHLIDLDPAVKAKLQELEVEVETVSMRRTNRGARLYAAALAAGKRIVVTSDMYLPKAIIRDVLHRGHYRGEERLIVSGDDGVAKQDGTSFLYLAREFPAQVVLHIGDDPIKDVKRARSSGVDGRLLSRPGNSPLGNWVGAGGWRLHEPSAVESLQASILRGLCEAHLDIERSAGPMGDVRAIGYNVLGPLLVGFSRFLDQEARRRGTDRLVFLAREGAIMQRGYVALQGDAALTSTYGVLSSRILGLANLSLDLDVEDMRFLTKSPIALTAGQFVRRVIPEIDDDRLSSALADAKVPAERRFHGCRADSALRPVFAALSDDLSELVRDTKAPLTQYLRSLELDDARTLVVDSGWVGTLQSAMGELLGTAVGGIYLGVHDTPASRNRSGMSGWVDGRLGGEYGKVLRTLYAHVQPLEVLLANAEVGSVVGIETDRSVAGGFSFAYLDSEFTGDAQETVAQLQDAAMAFISDWENAVSGLGEANGELLLRPALAPTLQLMTRPSLAQYRALGRLAFDGTYGVRPTVLGRWWVPDQFRRWI